MHVDEKDDKNDKNENLRIVDEAGSLSLLADRQRRRIVGNVVSVVSVRRTNWHKWRQFRQLQNGNCVPNSSHVSSVLPEMLQKPQMLQLQIARKVANVERVAVAIACKLQQRWDANFAGDKVVKVREPPDTKVSGCRKTMSTEETLMERSASKRPPHDCPYS